MLKKFDKKICLLAVAVLLLAGALIWLAVFWQLGKIREMSDDIQKEQLDSLVRQQRSQKILEMGKELGDLEKSQREMESMLVEKDDAVPFLKKIEEIAILTGNSIKINVVDLSKIKSQAAKKPAVQETDSESKEDLKKETQAQKKASSQETKPDYSNQLGFSVELVGRFGSLADFFEKLENFPYFARIINFQIAPAVKSQAGQAAAVSGVVQAPGEPGQAVQAEDESNKIKTIIVISVYTNGTK